MRKKGLALLALLLAVTLLPAPALAEQAADTSGSYANGEDTAPAGGLTEDETPEDALQEEYALFSGSQVAVQAADTPEEQPFQEIDSSRTITGTQDTGLKLSADLDHPNDPLVVTLDNVTIDLSGHPGWSPIVLAESATLKVELIIKGSVTLIGGNARGTIGAGAAIRVPANTTLTIRSAHDDRIGDTGTALTSPVDTLTVIGGNAADGANGTNGQISITQSFIGGASSYSFTWNVGSGGNGGGGAAAAIGGNGGVGGLGGVGAICDTNGNPITISLDQETGTFVFNKNDGDINVTTTSGSGSSDDASTDPPSSPRGAGSVRIVGYLNLEGHGGAGGSGGAGGEGGLAHALMKAQFGQTVMQDVDDHAILAGPGGGGGGGGGLAAPFIGTGGSGGAGGGSGGGGFCEPFRNETKFIEGGAGGGGWPNGGGGGAGTGGGFGVDDTGNDYAAYCHCIVTSTKSETTGKWLIGQDKTTWACELGGSTGLVPVSLKNGGAGGSAGGSGTVGGDIVDRHKRDYPSGVTVTHGTGGAGGTDAGGGSSGTGSSGGTGGAANRAVPWYVSTSTTDGYYYAPSFVLSSAVKMTSASYVGAGYPADKLCFGTGGGAGGYAVRTPSLLYDLRDYTVTVAHYVCTTSSGTGSGSCTFDAATGYYTGHTYDPSVSHKPQTTGSDVGKNVITVTYTNSSGDGYLSQKFPLAALTEDTDFAYNAGKSELVNCPGKVAVSGIRNAVLDDELADWDYDSAFDSLKSRDGGYLVIGTAYADIGIQQAVLSDLKTYARGTSIGGSPTSFAYYDTADTAREHPYSVNSPISLKAGFGLDSSTGTTVVESITISGSSIPLSEALGDSGEAVWTVTNASGGDCAAMLAVNGQQDTAPTFIPTAPGLYTVTLRLTGMANFKDTTVTSYLFVQSRPVPEITGLAHPGSTLTAKLPDGVTASSVTYAWSVGSSSAGTDETYTVQDGDANKAITVTITAITSEGNLYVADGVSSSVTVEDHTYTAYGFCDANITTVEGDVPCRAYQPAAKNGSVYEIGNAGQMFWFAALVNGDGAHGFTDKTTDAKARLTADIDLLRGNPYASSGEVEWTPIGSTATLDDRNVATDGGYNGTFDGQNHTVSSMTIRQKASCAGLFGYLRSGGTVKNLTVEGKISMVGGNNAGGDTGIGGVVGHMSGASTVSRVVSNVSITGDSMFHVGGIVGCMRSGNSASEVPALTESIFDTLEATGSPVSGGIALENSFDSIGGIAGCADGNVSYCASLGKIVVWNDVAPQYLFVGGAFGQIIGGSRTVASCFSYGSFTVETPAPTEGSRSTAVGLFVGRTYAVLRNCMARNDSPTFKMDGVTLNISLYGKDESNGTQDLHAATGAQFKSGEVCYLLNGGSNPAGDNFTGFFWRQDLDNGKTKGWDNEPAGTYRELCPHLKADDNNAAKDAVYYHRDGAYSNAQELVSVSITWGDMQFTYTAGQWNPETHSDGHTWTAANENGDRITVKNNGNTAVKAAFALAPTAPFNSCGLTGTFSVNGAAVTRAQAVNANETLTTKLNVASSDIPEETFETTASSKQIGTATVTLTVGE